MLSDGRLAASGLPIRVAAQGLSPRNARYCHFEGLWPAQVPAVLAADASSVLCALPDAVDGLVAALPAAAAVRLSSNGADLTPTSMALRLARVPEPKAVEPALGTVLGGTTISVTLAGPEGDAAALESFAEDRGAARCAFLCEDGRALLATARWTASRLLECDTPAARAADSGLDRVDCQLVVLHDATAALLFDGGATSTDPVAFATVRASCPGLPFRFAPAPVLLEAERQLAPRQGGTPLLLRVANVEAFSGGMAPSALRLLCE